MLLDSVTGATSAPTLTSALTLATVVAQGFYAHIKGRRGKRDTAAVLARIEHKLDDSIQRVNTLEIVTWGIDKTNGLRGDSDDHEKRIRELERLVNTRVGVAAYE